MTEARKQKKPEERLRRLFARPPARYAPTAFWFWNEPLDIRWLCWQAREMAAKGVRGFFIHGRSGLPREQYFAPIWWRAVRAVVEQARGAGSCAWLYDELGWPSGSAGGRVPGRGPDYQQHYLQCVPEDEAPPPDGTTIHRATLPDGRSLSFVQRRVAGYIDSLRPAVVRAFIEEAYERYWRLCGKNFGALIPGIFTDEPSMRCFALRTKEMAVAWSPILPEEFQRRCGYDLLDHLPSLFFDVGDCPAVRNDYYRTVAALFREAYGKQIFDWCQRHGLAYTGHYEYEGPLRLQIQCLGATMPLYRYMRMPGLDQLARWRVVHERRETLVLTKQMTSVAEQTGKERTLCEAFGVGGWDFPPRELRWMADWLFLLGINLLSPHGYYSSIAGDRKRDAPPDQFWRQPWWPISKGYHNHLARLCAALSQAPAEPHVLIIHPVTSAWVDHRPQDHRGIGDREEDPLGLFFNHLCEAVLEAHFDFHLGDEVILAEYGKVRGRRLTVGRCTYDAVVVPPMKNLGKATAGLLAGLVGAGGTVLRLRPTAALGWKPKEGEPPLVEGRQDPELASPLLRAPRPPTADENGQIAWVLRRLRRAVPRLAEVHTRPAALAPRISIRVGEVSPTARLVFLLNGTREPVQAAVRFAGRWSVERWVPANGQVLPVSARPAPDGRATSVSLPFAPQESYLLYLRRGWARSASPTVRSPKSVLLGLDGKWDVRLEQDNVLLLDRCRYRQPGKGGRAAWQPETPVFALRRRHREEGAAPTAMEFRFQVAREAAVVPLALAIEAPHLFRISLNGRTVPTPRRASFLLDRARKVVPLGGIGSGINTLVVEPQDAGAPLEDLYILGPFGVRGQASGWNIVAPSEQIALGDWCGQGYPFFPGPLRYRSDFHLQHFLDKPVWLSLGEVREACSIFLNGRPAADLLWPPFEVEISKLLRPGENIVEVVVYGSLRNLLGPHYAKNEDQRGGFGNDDFEPLEGWEGPQRLRPMGLMGPVRLRA